MSSELVLIVAAGGRQSGFLLPRLYQKRRLRLIVNSEKSQRSLQERYPDSEVVRADLSNTEDQKRIIKDVTTIYHVGPSCNPREAEIAYGMIDAAVEESKHGGFRHFVLSSVLNSQLSQLLNHQRKCVAEEYLIKSGLNFTILQPSHFMDNFPPVAVLLKQQPPVFSQNFDPTVPFSFTSLKDYSEVAAKVIMEQEKHYYAQYPLASTKPYNYVEVCKMVSKEIGKGIVVKQSSAEEALDAMRNRAFGTTNVPKAVTVACNTMLMFYNYHGLLGNPGVMEWLLERKATTHAEWARAQVEALKEQT